MIRVKNIEVTGWKAAIRGMRNPMNSWDRADSIECIDGFEIGPNDMKLAQDLTRAGTEHRKFLRMIHVQMDITAPLYWWKEMDQYRIGVTTNSCSTMHKLHAKEFVLDDFSHEHLLNPDKLNAVICCLNDYREMYVTWDDSAVCKDGEGNVVTKKDVWWQMIQLLPSSYNQKRTIDLNYETVINIIRQRSGHKLDEWRQFVDTLKRLPYLDAFCGVRKDGEQHE